MSNNIEIKSGTVISVTVPEQSPSNVTIAGMKAVGITDSRYEHTQETVGKVWEINHNDENIDTIKKSIILARKYMQSLWEERLYMISKNKELIVAGNHRP